MYFWNSIRGGKTKIDEEFAHVVSTLHCVGAIRLNALETEEEFVVNGLVTFETNRSIKNKVGL
jgi:hypothetical protein